MHTGNAYWVSFRKTFIQEPCHTHSSILAWEIPWTEEPGGLSSMGSHIVRHAWSDLVPLHRQAGSLPLAPPGKPISDCMSLYIIYEALCCFRAQSLNHHIWVSTFPCRPLLLPLLCMWRNMTWEVGRGGPGPRTQILCLLICVLPTLSLCLSHDTDTCSRSFRFLFFIVSARYVFSSNLWIIESLHIVDEIIADSEVCILNDRSHIWKNMLDQYRQKLCFNNQKWPCLNTLWDQCSLWTCFVKYLRTFT